MARKKKKKGTYELVIIALLVCIMLLTVVIISKQGEERNPSPTPSNTNQADPTPSPTETEYVEPTPDAGSTPKPDNLVEYKGRIEHIFFHSLIAYPELAFTQKDKEALVSTTWFIDFVTVSEFHKILDALYKDGYMLINANDIYEEVTEDGIKKYKVKPFMFPEGKKPLIMSFDDTNYYENKHGFGTIDKLILDNTGKVTTYTKMKDGREIISDENEHVPIVDKFIKEHPDFSYNGAKGMICLTGFEGILGYRTQRGSVNRQAEIEALKPVIKALKETGWYFASHSYKHGHMAKYSVEEMRDCASKFRDEVIPLIGETKLYVYPYGEWKSGEVQKILTTEFGFTYFASVGANYYLTTRADMEYILFQDRSNFDGFALMHNGPLITKYKGLGTDRFPSFDVDEIYNEEERTISRQEAMEIHGRLFAVSPR